MPRSIAAAPVEPRWQRLPDDRPRLLMASALKLLKRHGYRRVRLDDIAKDAGVCKGTVYHYFTDKDDLLTQAVASRMSERRLDLERRVTDAGGTAADRLRVILDEHWRHALTTQSGLWQRLVVGEMAKDAPEVFATWARGDVLRWKAVEAVIKEGQAIGEFRADADAAVAARLIVAGLAHLALFHVHLGMNRFAPCALDRLFDSSLDLLLRGVRATTRRASR